MSALADHGHLPDDPSDRALGDSLRLYEPERTPPAATTCAAGPTLPGIDVSHYQGVIDWNEVAASGIQFAIVRVSHGTNTLDNYFDANWDGARAAGIHTGVYQYFEPGQNVIAEADLLLDRMGPLEPGDLPPMIDVESTGGLPPAEVAAAVGLWIEHVEAAVGVPPLIYSGRYFWQDNVQSAAFADYPLMIAHYTTGCPNLPEQWTDWAIHQYTDSGSVAGISGAVDRDNFNGDEAKLLELGLPVVIADGSLDITRCEAIAGWTAIPGEPEPLDVLVVLDGEPGAAAAEITLTADLARDDLCELLGSCTHAFESRVPAQFLDDRPHDVSAFAIVPGGAPVALQGSPAQLQCPPPLGDVGTRRVVSAEAVARWQFTEVMDLLPFDPTDELPVGPALPPAPLLVAGDDGKVWLIDSGLRREIGASAATWGLDLTSAIKWPTSSVEGVPQGPGLPARPLLVTDRTSGTLVLIDAAGLQHPSEDDGGSPTGSGGGDPSGDEGGSSGGEDGSDPAAAAGAERGGCRIGGTDGFPPLAFALLVLPLWWGRARH